MLEARDIHKKYGELEVLKGVSLKVEKSEIVSIVGASGAGKSTLLQIIGTLDKPDSGSIKIDNTAIDSLNEKQLAKFRNEKIGFVFQFHHLLPEFTALENILIPAYLGKANISNPEKRAKELLDLLGLKNRMEHKPNALSGGEQQRVAVARALMNKPALVLADEPSGNLDSNNSKELHELFFRLRDELEQTFILVTHNKDLANMADRKLEMQDGLILS
ncbi:MAG: ABC transporter ATP-binding protein [Chitinophagales bacterium]